MEPFKNVFSPALVECLADHLDRRVPAFDRQQFEAAIVPQLDTLELKARAQLIADTVHAALPADGQQRADILTDMLHAEEGEASSSHSDEHGVRGWAIMPLSMVVGQHGVADFERSLEVLRQMTKRFTAEFAVRYFLLADQKRTLGIMTRWVDDPSHHVRRLVSEGTRPRLPWAVQLPQLIADPAPVLPLLEALRDDGEEYVRRSVANHINDIAKDHPGRVAGLARSWMNDASPDRRRLLRHACRTLIKQGHRDTLEVFGLGAPEIGPVLLEIPHPDVQFGDSVTFSATVKSTGKTAQSLLIDYIMHFVKADGRRSAKVFKWTRFELPPGETRTLTRTHAIRPITTRRYYPGRQAISLRINGQDFGEAEFELRMD